MLPVLLVSVTPYVGKNVVALGIAEKFRREGKSVGYFKPIGPLPILVDGLLKRGYRFVTIAELMRLGNRG